MQLTPALQALINQRLALVDEMLPALVDTDNIVVTPLTEPDPATPIDSWERSCDVCRKHCPYPVPFWTGHIVETTKRGHQLLITFGVCREHKPEGVR